MILLRSLRIGHDVALLSLAHDCNLSNTTTEFYNNFFVYFVPLPEGWNEQCKNLKGKTKNALSSLRKLKNILPQFKLDQVYKALLESHLRYSDELWGKLSNTKLDQLQRLQNRARTLIEGSRLKDGWSCNWHSVSNLIKFDRAAMICKIINGLFPDNLKGILVTRSQISNYSTRTCLHLDTPRKNLEFSKRSFFYCGTQA